MIGARSVAVQATSLLLFVVIVGTGLSVQGATPKRRGKVIVIRGAFTVFSLGLNELGD
jgi:hypothetical protein